MIVSLIIMIVIMVVFGIFTYKEYKKCNSLLEKILYVCVYFIVLAPIIIYYCDRFNIPSILTLDKNLDTQSWLSFCGNYISSIVSAIIGALALVLMTKYQIRKNDEENEKRSSENNRIQNMPLLKYKIETSSQNQKIDIDHLIISKYSGKTTSSYELNISIKNIGLNSVKKIIVDLESDMVSERYRLLGADTQIPIEKNENKEIYRYFALESGKEYLMNLKVYYEDVLQNWYLQTVEINYNATKINNGTSQIGQVSYKVNEEQLINKNDISILDL